MSWSQLYDDGFIGKSASQRTKRRCYARAGNDDVTQFMAGVSVDVFVVVLVSWYERRTVSVEVDVGVVVLTLTSMLASWR